MICFSITTKTYFFETNVRRSFFQGGLDINLKFYFVTMYSMCFLLNFDLTAPVSTCLKFFLKGILPKKFSRRHVKEGKNDDEMLFTLPHLINSIKSYQPKIQKVDMFFSEIQACFDFRYFVSCPYKECFQSESGWSSNM